MTNTCARQSCMHGLVANMVNIPEGGLRGLGGIGGGGGDLGGAGGWGGGAGGSGRPGILALHTMEGPPVMYSQSAV